MARPRVGRDASRRLPLPRQRALGLFLLGGAIMLTVLGFNLLGDGLRDALDPRTL